MINKIITNFYIPKNGIYVIILVTNNKGQKIIAKRL